MDCSRLYFRSAAVEERVSLSAIGNQYIFRHLTYALLCYCVLSRNRVPTKYFSYLTKFRGSQPQHISKKLLAAATTKTITFPNDRCNYLGDAGYYKHYYYA